MYIAIFLLQSHLGGIRRAHLALDWTNGLARGLGVRELELELIQTQMTQKPMLWAEVYARALRASQNHEEGSV